MDKTKIQWTDATWNPVRGCSRVSPGCDNCAMRQAHRSSGPGGAYEGLTRIGKRGVDWAGFARLVPDQLEQPLRWKRPRRIFVASMSDPFHASLFDYEIDRIFAAMVLADWHQYQLLTKRPDRALTYLVADGVQHRILRAVDSLEVDFAMAGVPEEWRAVIDAPAYEVSNHGNVRRGERQLALVEHGNGYHQVALSTHGKVRTALVHRLVLAAFDRPARETEEAAHRNGNRVDNRIANLRWASKSDNMQDPARQGTAGVWMKGRATLTAEEVADVRAARARGEKLTVLAARYGTSKQQISAIALGKIFKPPQLTWPLPQLWLGVSAENQATADERIPLLLELPAAVRFVSAEPLLGPLDLRKYLNVGGICECDPAEAPSSRCERKGRNGWIRCNAGMRRLNWVIAGGESGNSARPCDVVWLEDLVLQCREQLGMGIKPWPVPLFVKQLGSVPFDSRESHRYEEPYDGGPSADPSCRLLLAHRKGGDMSEWPEALRVREFPNV